MTRPTDTQIAEARKLVSDPALFGPRPGARGIAWATLKRARGQTYDFTRLPMVRHHTGVGLTLTERLDETAEDRRRRIHARAAELGMGPYGGDAAGAPPQSKSET
ncbi:hypothetical protein [uncultured Roseovarius sp.]|uniref:hypothetical protein n=1 Tax=uncultured Roseovarius sp. TaxID=293344 RepID=UPI000C375F8B|nr:hypothetical protein [Roseovarius sp.]MBD11602.1 hypothetical protein [Roseovarius sp.]|tara:strand:+ start:932 stop:1246 length:315 start_codon:yes stop_codon:yes gene_type:complete